MAKKKTFEEASARIDAIVSQMEDDQLSLDQMIKMYSEGMELVNFCNKELDKATLSIEKIELPQ